MQETLHDHHTSICIGGRPISNLRFASDTDFMDGSNGERQDHANRLVDRGTAYRKKVSTEKDKIMANSMKSIRANILV